MTGVIKQAELLAGTVVENILLGDNIVYPESGKLTLGQGVKIKQLNKVPTRKN